MFQHVQIVSGINFWLWTLAYQNFLGGYAATAGDKELITAGDVNDPYKLQMDLIQIKYLHGFLSFECSWTWYRF